MTVAEPKLIQSLSKKWNDQQLGHFLLLQNKNTVTAPSELNQWTKSLVTTMTGLSDDVFEKGHPDILWIESDEKESKYSHLDNRFIELFSHSDYKPISLTKKIIVLEKSYLLSEILANKLLKTLEDAREYTLFIFLNPASYSIMDTIKSRAIKLTINTSPINKSVPPSNLLFKDWIEDLSTQFVDSELDTFKKVKEVLLGYSNKEKSLSETIEVLKKSKINEKMTFKVLTKWMAYTSSSYNSSNKSLDTIEWWEEQATFHNSSYNRLENLLRTSL